MTKCTARLSHGRGCIGKKTWDHFDYDIMLWSDRGKGRPKSYGTEKNIARIVMGAHLIGFLINECYGTARLISYVMLADTIRGNGCLGEDGNGTMR